MALNQSFESNEKAIEISHDDIISSIMSDANEEKSAFVFEKLNPIEVNVLNHIRNFYKKKIDTSLIEDINEERRQKGYLFLNIYIKFQNQADKTPVFKKAMDEMLKDHRFALKYEIFQKTVLK